MIAVAFKEMAKEQVNYHRERAQAWEAVLVNMEYSTDGEALSNTEEAARITALDLSNARSDVVKSESKPV